ncbi:MAG: sugar phosphate isomerase/epimerase [Chloroflexi bacterium]|nr:sugar phosphate isomerase/epimerase [Chloroflexota bacterium]
MKFGVCDASFDRIPVAIEAGIDYVEMGVSNTLMPLEPEATFAPVRAKIEALAVRPEAFNLFFPGTVRITGPNVDWELVRRYSAVAVQRCAQVGGQSMVIGSGGARNVPDGFSWDEAWGQLRQAFRIVGEEAAKVGVTIVIEPLRRQESNIVNYTTEGYRLAQEVNHPNICVLADFYHMAELDEPLTNLLEIAPLLRHVHVADTGRFRPGSGAYDYAGFMKYLKQTGYNARISMEGNWHFEQYGQEVADGLAFLRKMWAAA